MVLVERHLHELNWTHGILAERSGISESRVSQWFTGKSDLKRNHINRLAAAIARGYEEAQHRAGQGLDNLDGLLNELLLAGGFSAITGRDRNVVWTRLSTASTGQRQLRVGWVPYPPFCYLKSPIPGPVGFSVDVMKRIAELIGAEITWHPYNWSDVISGLVQREVDVICPILLVLPTRMFQIHFSDTLPEIFIPINGLVNKKYLPRILSGDEINVESVFINYVAGEAGQDLCTMFAPKAPAEAGHASASDACKDILANPLDDDGSRVRCFVADHTICRDLQQRHSQTLALVYSPYPDNKIRLPIAAGVHLEEVKFLALINRCLHILRDTGYFTRLYASMAAELNALDILRPPTKDK